MQFKTFFTSNLNLVTSRLKQNKLKQVKIVIALASGAPAFDKVTSL